MGSLGLQPNIKKLGEYPVTADLVELYAIYSLFPMSRTLHPVVIHKGTPVGHMVAANIIPEKMLLPGTLEALDQPNNHEAQLLSIEE